jgi:hypothetical protein
MNDVIRMAIDRACVSMGGNDGLFSAAGFANAILEIARSSGTIDGKVIRVILTGRPDVMPAKDGSHYWAILK